MTERTAECWLIRTDISANNEVVLMYSNNDWRCYQEYDNYLEHRFRLQDAKNKLKSVGDSFTKTISNVGNKLKTSASNAVSTTKSKISELGSKSSNKSSTKKTEEKKETVSAAKPGKWEWPNGKNSKEYNHWYYENHTKIKNMEARIASGEIDEPVFNGKRWSEMSDFEKQMYMDKGKDSNITEFFLSQWLVRPLSLITGNVGAYASMVGREFTATHAYLKTAEQVVERKLSRGEVDSETGFKKKTKEMSREEDLNQINPGFMNWDTNSKNNCMLCTTTYDLRRRGYDVTANTSTTGFEVEALKDWYPDAEIKTVESEPITTNYFGEIDAKTYWKEQPGRASRNADKLISELEKQPDGARGNLMVYWAGFTGGHSMVYEIVDGELMILDGQSNQIYDSDAEIRQLLQNCDGDFNYARLDNVDVDPDAIKRASRS